MTKPIELYYWPTPNGWKISIFLEEAELPYEMKPVNIGKGEQFDDAFLKFSPNNKMPAIIDPDGPGGAPIAIFESGAILQYLGRKTGLFYPTEPRAQMEVEQWLFWQCAGLGPMLGQAHHFRNYAPEKIAYAVDRYTNEANRLYGVLDLRLRGRDFIAGDYSIADMAAWPWILPEGQGQTLDDFPDLKAWHARMADRPAVQRGRALGAELRMDLSSPEAEEARKVLFGQKAR